MLELWGMRSTPSLPLLPDLLDLGAMAMKGCSAFYLVGTRLGVVAPDSVLSMGQIELNCILKQN